MVEFSPATREAGFDSRPVQIFFMPLFYFRLPLTGNRLSINHLFTHVSPSELKVRSKYVRADKNDYSKNGIVHYSILTKLFQLTMKVSFHKPTFWVTLVLEIKHSQLLDQSHILSNFVH